jgi:hypothetical protein
MSVNNRKRRRQPAQQIASRAARGRYGWLCPFVFGALLAGVIVFAVTRNELTESKIGQLQPPSVKGDASDLPTLGQLTEMSADDLSRQDIAFLNLRCAEGLPGAEKLDIPKCLATLDKWAAWVKHETDRHLYKFRRNPKEYENSEAYFRMLMLITVLQQDFKIQYNPDRIRDVDFTKSQDLFIHGMIDNNNGGTCVSMPVLYTAVARRLGYPVYLVSAKAHLFCRWHDKKNYVNCEATSQGLSTFKDSYYMQWPKPISAAEIKAGHYLKSLPSAEEFAVFLSARGHCLEDTGKTADAVASYAQALRRRPDSPDYFAFLANCMGFRKRPALPPIVRRAPSQPPSIYPGAYDPYTYANPPNNPGAIGVQTHAQSLPHDVFNPYDPSTGFPNGVQNPVTDPRFGFPHERTLQ